MSMMIAIIKNGGQLTVPTGPIVERDRSFYGTPPECRSATAEDGIAQSNGPVPNPPNGRNPGPQRTILSATAAFTTGERLWIRLIWCRSTLHRSTRE